MEPIRNARVKIYGAYETVPVYEVGTREFETDCQVIGSDQTQHLQIYEDTSEPWGEIFALDIRPVLVKGRE